MLALLFLSWGFSCYWFFAFIQGAPFFSRPVTTFIGPMISLTLFPPIFLYIKYLFYEYPSFKPRDHLHFLPVYLFIVFTLYLYWAGNFTIAGMRAHPWYHARTMISSYIAMIQGPCYFYATNRIMKIRYKKLLEEYSDIEQKKLHWLKVINYSFVLIFVIGGISTVIKSAHLNPYYLYLGYHFVMGVSLFYITLKVFGIPELFTAKPSPYGANGPTRPFRFEALSYPNPFISYAGTTSQELSGKQQHAVKPPENTKDHNGASANLADVYRADYSRSNAEMAVGNITNRNQGDGNQGTENHMPTFKDVEVIQKLEQIMAEQKLYKDPNINLHDLAFAIDETRNSLSSALNHQLNKPFYDYINDLRVEESKKLLSDPKKANYTIEAIAAEAGFKTMSVFYRFFKDIVKVTPTQFRKQVVSATQVIENE